jgi:vacuolar-type H+-ATPase subunit F/Vma7
LKKIAFLTPGDAGFGFGLAGMSQYTVKEAEAEEMLKKIISEGDTGLIIIDERMIKKIEKGKMRETEERWSGILLVLPSPIKPSLDIEDYAVRLIRRAIGYHVRLKL